MPNKPNNARPKRGAEVWTRTHHQEGEGSDAKKARFDLRNPSALAPDAPDDEEDAFLEADELTKRGGQTKRNAVNIDGFESDSSNEGFDARADVKAKAKKEAEKAESKDEEDNDMFADLEEDTTKDGDDDEELSLEGKKKKKAVNFADLDKVEDLEEVGDSKSGGHVSADLHARKGKEVESSSDSDSEVDDEIRAGVGDDMDAELGAGSKKKHAPKLDAFNLRNENQEGGFDESLNYVRKAADPDAAFDNWMEGMSKKDMRKAKEAHEKRDRELRKKNREDDAVVTSDVLGTLISILEPGETSLRALARFAPKKEKKKPKWLAKKQKEKNGEMDIETPAETNKEETQRREAVEAITGATDVLMARGVIDINDTREVLMLHYKKEAGQEWVDTSSDASEDDDDAEMWEFRWVGATDSAVQGPEPRDKMKAWNDAGYFLGGVEVRPAGSKGPWRTDIAF